MAKAIVAGGKATGGKQKKKVNTYTTLSNA